MSHRLRKILARIILAGLSSEAVAVEFSGEAAFDSRAFLFSPAFQGQRSQLYYPSLMLRPELKQEWNDGADSFSFSPFLRIGAFDDARNHWDIREFSWRHNAGDWDILAGVGKVFWGVTESRHLVDIVNQTDFLEDIDLEEKLGQPMVNVNFSGNYGAVSLFFLPYFRERYFENRAGRFRPFIPINDNFSEYQSHLKEWHPDVAGRWSKTIGSVDIGLAQFYGTSREPTYQPALQSYNNPILKPRYDIIDQTSLDLQLTQGAWLWKLEAMTRGGQGKRFGAVVAGLEYTLFDLNHFGIDIGLLAEYLYDGRDSNPAKAPPTPYNNDIFLGLRLAVNDVQNTELLVGLVQDINNAAKFVNVEASRRIGDAWKVEMEARFIMDASFNDFVLYSFHRDDYIQLRIARFF